MKCMILCQSLLTIFLIIGCGGENLEPNDLQKDEVALLCPGQGNKLVTVYEDHIGPKEDGSFVPEGIGHSTAAELLYSDPNAANERFAVAWITPASQIAVRRYNISTSNFMDFSTLHLNDASYWSSSDGTWIRSLGPDDNCTHISGQSQCAWFTWNGLGGTFYWRAVGAAGTTSQSILGTIRSKNGYEPSGDRGIKYYGWPFYNYVRKRLIAWIDTDRRKVWAQLLTNSGETLNSPILIRQIADANFHAYQTEVAWSSNEDRWLIAWTESYDSSYVANGRIYTRYVDFNGNMEVWNGSPVAKMYCEGDGTSALCPPSSAKEALSDPIALTSEISSNVRTNDRCFCKGIWLASSYYSNSFDRFRLAQYGVQASLNSNGDQSAIIATSDPTYSCSTYCPITEAGIYHGYYNTPFQMLEDDYPNTKHLHLIQQSFLSFNEGIAISGYRYPQAFRSNGNVAVAVASNGYSELMLSIVNVKNGGCP